MILLDGRGTADRLNEALKQKIAVLKDKPRLEIILIGDDPASMSYVKGNLKLQKVLE